MFITSGIAIMTDEKKSIEQKNTVTGNNIQAGVLNTGIMGDVTVTMGNMTQTISNLPTATEDDKAKLNALVKQLEEALKALPAEQQKDAEKVAKRTQELVSEIETEEPETDLIQAKATALQNAAKNIASVMPIVGGIVASIFNIAKITIGG
jgi:uncharacterized protein Yka (UPF0111/DUF47 family)